MKQVVLVQQCPAKYFHVFKKAHDSMDKFRLFDKIYLVTDYTDAINELDDRYIIKVLDHDLGFSSNLMSIMDDIKEDIFFFSPEDHIPHKVDISKIAHAITKVESNTNIGLLRLICLDRYPLEDNSKFISRIQPGKCYLSIGMMGIWRKEYFRKFLFEGETAWDFERKGTVRALNRKDNHVYGVNKTVYLHIDYLKNGSIRKIPKKLDR